MQTGNMLCLGESDYFRYNQNLTEEMSNNKSENSSSIISTTSDTNLSLATNYEDDTDVKQLDESNGCKLIASETNQIWGKNKELQNLFFSSFFFAIVLLIFSTTKE